MKSLKWLVIISLIVFSVLFLASVSLAFTNEEIAYIEALSKHMDNMGYLLEDTVNYLTNANPEEYDDPSYVVGLVIQVALLGKEASQAKDIPCPKRFRESNAYYLQSMYCIEEYSRLFINAIKTNDIDGMNAAFNWLHKGILIFDKFNATWLKETGGV